MSTDRESIQLELDEVNELVFKVSVQGADSMRVKTRMVCEADGLSYMFDGRELPDGDMRFVVPVMKGRLSEGVSYKSRVEVLVEDKYFSPVEFDLTFKQSVKVVTEGGIRVRSPSRDTSPVAVSVSAQVLKATPVATREAPSAVQETKSKPSPLRDRVSQKVSVTGLDNMALEEVARSVVKKLLEK